MSWNTQDMAATLPEVDHQDEQQAAAPLDPNAPPTTKLTFEDGQTPQQKGWVAKTGLDYQTYGMTSKEYAETQAAQGESGAEPDSQILDPVGGLAQGDWASNGAVYEWSEEYGDVGPEFPELEKQLFGGDHVRKGLAFDKIASISVVQEGNVRIKPVMTFKDAGLHPVMLRNVELAGYDVPTPIQQYTLPAIHQGQDIVACAQTGSGKTAAFLIPILSKLMGKAKKLCADRPNPAQFQAGLSQGVRAEPLVLIVAPSRELAVQIFDEARRFCYRTMFRPCVVYGGGPLPEQIAQLQKGCDILIGTPGRLIDFISRPHVLTLKRLKYMVLDEADEMVGQDWESDLKQIMSGGDQEEGNIIYMMFSATFPKMAQELAVAHLRHDHVRIRIGRAGSSHMNIKQDVIFCEPSAKRQALFDLLMSAPPARTMIFVNSKRTADEVDDFLFNSDIPCTSIHADRTQREREDSIRAFRTGKCPVLIATGVSARGLDINNVMHVINYDLPSMQYGGIQEYIHRIGRTGRIGNKGLATSFYNSRDEDIAGVLVKTLLETGMEVPDFLQDHIPEGYTGDVTTLNFEEEAEAEDGGFGDEGAAATGGDDGWGAPAPAVQAADPWGAPAQASAPQAAADPWGQPAPVQAAPTKAPAPAPATSGRGSPSAPAPASSGWDSGATGGGGW